MQPRRGRGASRLGADRAKDEIEVLKSPARRRVCDRAKVQRARVRVRARARAFAVLAVTVGSRRARPTAAVAYPQARAGPNLSQVPWPRSHKKSVRHPAPLFCAPHFFMLPHHHHTKRGARIMVCVTARHRGLAGRAQQVGAGRPKSWRAAEVRSYCPLFSLCPLHAHHTVNLLRFRPMKNGNTKTVGASRRPSDVYAHFYVTN